MKNLLFLSLFLLFSCQTTKKYLKSNGIDCDCTAIILEMQNIFYKIDEEKNLYNVRFKSENKKEQHAEYKELLQRFSFVMNTAEKKCVQKLDKKMIEKIFGEPTSHFSKFNIHTYSLVLNPTCIDTPPGADERYQSCNYLEFGFFEDDKVKIVFLAPEMTW